MKKSVILSIVLVYLVSVFVVGLMGIQMKVYDKVKYVEEITYVPLGVLDESKGNDKEVYYKGSRYLTEKLTYGENGKLSEVRIVQKYERDIAFELNFRVLPDDATITENFNKKLFRYEWDASKEYKEDEEGNHISGSVKYSVNSDGNAVVKFMVNKNEDFIFTVFPDDGKNNVSVKVVIRVIANNAYVG